MKNTNFLQRRTGKAQDKKLVKKATTVFRHVAVRGGKGVADKIATIKAMVEKRLGKYAGKYNVIRDEESLEQYIRTAIKNGVIAIDTETTGLDPLQDELVGICIYTPTLPASYIPVNHVSYVTDMRVEDQLDTRTVGRIFKRLEKQGMERIMFNSKFDIRFIRHHLGVNLECTWDCYLAARLLNENEGYGNNGLKQLHRKYVLDGKGDAFSFDDLFAGVPFDKIPVKTAYLYAAHDAIITYELYEYQKKHLRLDHERQDMRNIASVFFNIEMPCVNVVADMEDTGVGFDLQYAKKLSEKYHKLLEEKTNKFYSLCDEFGEDLDKYRAQQGAKNKLEYPINISSSTQLAIMLYDVLGVEPPDKKSPRGTGVEILKKIDHPIAKAILEYREVTKLLSTYIDKLPECINPKDGRIHCSFNQYGADTGRFSSNNPNLQNIPSHNKDIRKMFVASDGYVLMSSDYSQQEPKVMTQMCGDPKMIKAYQEGKDLYAEIAALSFNTTYDNCLEFRPDGTTNPEGKSRRSQAKSILLGVLYGRGVPSIAEQLGTTTKKAQAIKDSVFKGFPAIPKFEKDSLRMAYEKGYVTTLWGRKRRLPDLQLDEYEFSWKDGVPPDDDPLGFDDVDDFLQNEVPQDIQDKYIKKLSKCWGSQKRAIFEQAYNEGIKIKDNGAKIADAQRQCVNARIQGSAADMSKLAMIKVGNDKKLKKLGFRLLIPVHDELIGECPEENAKECAKRFAQLMSEAAESKLEIPIKCDVEITRRWYGEAVV